MSNSISTVTAEHLRRAAIIYLRQSSPGQILRNRESTDRQYQLVSKAMEMGWRREQITVIDEDLGISAEGTVDRSGFDHMTAEVALGRVGIVMGLELSRVARSNAEWYRLFDLCGITGTLVADNDGLYHPGDFNDRLVLGMKAIMSEAELHILRSRLDGGIRNKAARGELRRGLPVGFIWGEGDGEVLFHPDEAVKGAISTVFERFDELGSVRQVWLWFRSQELSFPLQSNRWPEIQWVSPTYTAIHHVLTNPVYAGAYVYGKTKQERYVDEAGRIRKRIRKLSQADWSVLIRDHHPGFIEWEHYERNKERIGSNIRPRPHGGGGAVREGAALLQGVAICGHCGRRLSVYYQGKNSTPGYHCAGDSIVNGRGTYCLRVGGVRIDEAVAAALLAAVTPAGIKASLQAAEMLEAERDAALDQWRLEVERIRYEAERAERRYRAVEPENRLVARGLEAEWEKQLRELALAEAELERREQRRPRTLNKKQRQALVDLGVDVGRVWSAPTTTDRNRKELLRTLLEEVIVAVDRATSQAHLTMRWRGGMMTEIDVSLWRTNQPSIRTDEDTIDLVRRLAEHYSDATIAGILNRQGRRTATGLRFTANRVGNLRRHWGIARFEPSDEPVQGDLVTVEGAAQILGVAPSTVHRWLNDGFIAGEQLTPGAPWRIRMNEELRARFIEKEREGYVPMIEATKILGVSRQTVLQRVKRGELEAVHLCRGKRKGLRIKVIDVQQKLFEERS